MMDGQLEPPHGPLVIAEGLSLGYGRRPVLDEIALTIAAGQFWFLLGPNGQGKTTLLRALLGELPAASGRLTLHPSLHDRAAVG
ncbi:MAG: ATP-binding cassette domain-containing protein, partial [Candidatus Binatia bacterium]